MLDAFREKAHWGFRKMVFRGSGLALLAIAFLHFFTAAASLGQGPFGRGAGSGRLGASPRPLPTLPPGLIPTVPGPPGRLFPSFVPPSPRSLAAQRALMVQPAIVAPIPPGIILGRTVPGPVGPFSRLLGPAPAIALVVPVPTPTSPEAARRNNAGGRYEAGGSSYSTARPSLSGRGNSNLSANGVEAGMNSPLRPGMVLPDGSIVVSVGPVNGPANNSGSRTQNEADSDPTSAATPKTARTPSSGSSDRRFPSDSGAAPSSGTKSILEVETLPLPPPTDESR